MNPLLYWIWLSLRCGAGSESGTFLLSVFGSPRAVYEAGDDALGTVQGIDGKLLRALTDRGMEREKLILSYCERMKIGILTPDSEQYPERLRAIHAKPLVLYYLGRLPDFNTQVSLSCVGTRACSEGGRQNAFRLGYDLALSGAVVVSGMARGIDTASQRGALAAGGHTVAVLGCGLDHVYPPENRGLMVELARKGTLLTEFAPGCKPNARNFPIRNRIISGLSQGTVVVEADLKSGSLITARQALRQGRDIFAYPGNAMDNRSMGTNALIRDGAALVSSALDVLQEYELLYPHKIFSERLASAEARRDREQALAFFMQTQRAGAVGFERESATCRPREEKQAPTPPVHVPMLPVQDDACRAGLTEQERCVLSLIDREISCEELALLYARQTRQPADISAMLGILTMLEMSGLVEAAAGGLFRPRKGNA